MAANTMMIALVLALSVFTVSNAATISVGSAVTLVNAVKSAAAGDTIVFSGNFNITKGFGVKISKSLFFSGAVTIGVLTPIGILITGDSSVTVSFRNIVFSGYNVPLTNSAIKVSSSGGSKKTAGPTVTFTTVTFTAFNDVATTIYDGRGASLFVNTGTTVALISSLVSKNFAYAGGAISNTGGSKLYVCDSNFVSNTASTAFLISGSPANVAAPDVWVGRGSLFTYIPLVGKTYSNPIIGSNTSAIVSTKTGFTSCPSLGVVFPSTSGIARRFRLLY